MGDPLEGLGDLGGAEIGAYMTNLRRKGYTPKKARSAARAIVERFKRDKAWPQHPLVNSTTRIKTELVWPSVEHEPQSRKPLIKLEPNMDFAIKREPNTFQAEQCLQRLMPSQQRFSRQTAPNKHLTVRRFLQPKSAVKIEEDSLGYARSRSSSRSQSPQFHPYEFPALEPGGITGSGRPPGSWSDLMPNKSNRNGL